MKILQILNSTCFGGIEAHVMSLAMALGAAGHPTYIACRPNPPAELVAAMKARKLTWFEGPMRGALDPASLAWLGILRRETGAEVIHAHQTSDAMRALMISLMSGTRAVFTRHCCYPVRRATGLALAGCHGIIAVSGAVKNTLLAAGLPEGRVRVIYHGIADLLNPGSPPMRRVTGFHENRPVAFVICARISDEKNQALALDALEILTKTRPDLRVKLIIAGGAYGKDAIYLDRLIERVAETDLDEKVIFKGHVDDVAALLEEADAGLITSRTEGLSYSLLEYMSTGLPVISTPCEGPSEIIGHQIDGLVACSNPESFALAMAELAGNEQKRVAMGLAARKKFLHAFTLGRMVSETLEVYSDDRFTSA